MKRDVVLALALALVAGSGTARAREPTYKVDFGEAAARASKMPTPSLPAERAQIVNVPEVPAAAFVLKGNQAALPVNVNDVPVLTRGEVLLSKTISAPQPRAITAPPTGVVRLPYEARFIAENGELKTIHIVAELAGEGLRLVGSAKSFSTAIFVRLEVRGAPTSTGELPQALEILATGPVDKVDPEPLAIKTFGSWHKITLFAANPPENISVKLRARIDRDGLELRVPVRRPTLGLSVSPQSLQGFGLEAATMTVRAEGLPQPSGRTVLLQTTSGRMSATSVKLDANGIGTLDLRSSGVGSATITATSPPLSPASAVTVPLRWPLRFLAFALAGGAVGAFISMARKRKSSKAKIPWLELAAGILLGLLVAVCAALGVNLTGIELPTLATDISVFFLAGAGALGLAGPLSLQVPGQAGRTAE